MAMSKPRGKQPFNKGPARAPPVRSPSLIPRQVARRRRTFQVPDARVCSSEPGQGRSLDSGRHWLPPWNSSYHRTDCPTKPPVPSICLATAATEPMGNGKACKCGQLWLITTTHPTTSQGRPLEGAADRHLHATWHLFALAPAPQGI
jgi:hypothetical protein